MNTKFLLDSGDPVEYEEAQELARANNSEIWGSTTNPTLIAKKLAGQKVTQQEAFSNLQKQIVEKILNIVPGIVSAEVYSDHTTTAEQMIEQGKEIATWHERIAVKLPTTLEGFKARTELRKLGILINNTLVFSQEQSFAILLHEKIMISQFGKPKNNTPCFISPFVGRLDDIGIDGMSFIEDAIKTQREFFEKDTCWMLEASVRHLEHLQKGIDLGTELITSPLKVYQQYFSQSNQSITQTTPFTLAPIPYWLPSENLLSINSVEDLIMAIQTNELNINHELTDKGIDKFVADWKTIIS